MYRSLLLHALLVFATLQPLSATAYDPSRDGKADLLNALQRAKETNKHVLVVIGGEWCPSCKALDRAIAASPQIQTMLAEQYVFLKINYSRENKNEAAMKMLPFFIGYPKLFVLNPDGSVARSPSLWWIQRAGEFDSAALYKILSEPSHSRAE